ncbi:MAG TPA: hypothetical protein VN283_13050 [Thiobacillus sp.]|nr:hypothetical protein [Thiobacillus sp.]
MSHHSRAPDEAPTAEEGLATHAKRALLTRLRARVTAVLDAGIAFLQKLRKKAGGGQGATEGEDRPGARNDRPKERQGSAAPQVEADAPKPKRRLRAFLIYVGLMLAGGLGGGALAYTQFQKQVDRQLEESRGLEAALAKKTQPSANTLKTFEEELLRRDKVEKKLAATFAEFTESTDNSYSLLKNLLGRQFAENRRLEAALAENAKSSAKTRQALEEEQATRTGAEEKLASSLAEHSKSATEQQQQLDAAEKQLAMLAAGEGTRNVQREAPASRRNDGSRTRPPRSGNFTVNTKNVGSLKGCIDDFNQ